MYHLISLGLSSDLLRQLDDLRRVYPEQSRKDIIASLIRNAHAGVGARDRRDAMTSAQGSQPAL